MSSHENDTSMSTNIEEIPDPLLSGHIDNNIIDKKTLHIESIPYNSHNSYNSQHHDMTYKNDNNNNSLMIFNEHNLLLILFLLIAGLPQSTETLISILPIQLHNNIIVNIIKACLLCVLYLFIIYYVV